MKNKYIFPFKPKWVVYMSRLEHDVKKVREQIKKGPADTLISQKPFADGMYHFSMFMIGYYSRVKKELNIDYDSFMIVQTTVSHALYALKKKKNNTNYEELEGAWLELVKEKKISSIFDGLSANKDNRLSVSSICLVTGLPKETVRRKVSELTASHILKNSKKNGVILGSQYSSIFRAFVPETVMQVSRLLKIWEKNGIIKNLISFKT